MARPGGARAAAHPKPMISAGRIARRVRQLGATAMSITHDMVSARKIADRIAMLHQGRIVWHGPTPEIDHSGNPFVDQFINGRAEGPIQMEIRAA